MSDQDHIEVYHRIPVDARDHARIDVYGSGEDGWYEWHLVRAGHIEHDTVL